MFRSQSLSTLNELILILMESNLGCHGAESCQGDNTLVFVLFLLLAWEISRTNSNRRTSFSVHSAPENFGPFAVIFGSPGSHKSPAACGTVFQVWQIIDYCSWKHSSGVVVLAYL